MTGIMVSTLASGSMKFDAPTISARQTAAAVTRNLCHQPTATGGGSAGRLAHYVVRRKRPFGLSEGGTEHGSWCFFSRDNADHRISLGEPVLHDATCDAGKCRGEPLPAGVGVPMVLVSGRLAAERVLGRDPPTAPGPGGDDETPTQYRGRPVPTTPARARGWSAVSARALDAAGITDPALRAAFAQCRSCTPRTARPTTWPPAAAPGQAPLRLGALRLRPLGRRVRRRPRASGPRRRCSTGASAPRRSAAGGDSGRSDRRAAAHTVRALGHPASLFEAFSPRCGWTSASPATRPTPTSSGYSTARPW